MLEAKQKKTKKNEKQTKKKQRELSTRVNREKKGPPLHHFEINKGTCWAHDFEMSPHSLWSQFPHLHKVT